MKCQSCDREIIEPQNYGATACIFCGQWHYKTKDNEWIILNNEE